jgi:predicted amidohydrolase
MSPTPDRVVAAVVQMTSTTDVERNLATAEALVTRAAARGARLVGLPENFAFLRSEGEPAPEPQPLDGPWVRRMAALARRLEITLLLGSLPEKVEGEPPPNGGPTPGDKPRVRNTSVLLGPDGTTLAVYSKIHLFDIDLPGMEHLKESRAVDPGREIVVADSPAGPLGLSICYDLRFPELYRALARRGARVLCVPSAFTERTGKAHWEVLLRARAIENLAYVLAPAQVGHHGGGRASFGDAMIVDPWGAVIARVPDGEDVAVAELDFARLERLRRELPALSHARLLPAEPH